MQHQGSLQLNWQHFGPRSSPPSLLLLLKTPSSQIETQRANHYVVVEVYTTPCLAIAFAEDRSGSMDDARQRVRIPSEGKTRHKKRMQSQYHYCSSLRGATKMQTLREDWWACGGLLAFSLQMTNENAFLISVMKAFLFGNQITMILGCDVCGWKILFTKCNNPCLSN